mmetsp:Transcript_40251/g.59161  ORF Transcript_40251/g.59161 Transcript_40251/m.59161 type:complete len:153 (+) Transcript_40251:154-612(+)
MHSLMHPYYSSILRNISRRSNFFSRIAQMHRDGHMTTTRGFSTKHNPKRLAGSPTQNQRCRPPCIRQKGEEVKTPTNSDPWVDKPFQRRGALQGTKARSDDEEQPRLETEEAENPMINHPERCGGVPLVFDHRPPNPGVVVLEHCHGGIDAG